ncbi:MAG: hypothetical protein COB60_07720 [Flavobacteriaceae bacterium]|nr:MAG: hypothetical protein COB60_07720 [Flavobacteriaceae bacterium]
MITNKKIYLLSSIILVLLINCTNKEISPERFKTGTFEIPAEKGYSVTHILRIDSLQIERYEKRIDTLIIHWETPFKYNLKMLHPKTELDKDLIHVKITDIKEASYDFEATIGQSNYKQKGTLLKINN